MGMSNLRANFLHSSMLPGGEAFYTELQKHKWYYEAKKWEFFWTLKRLKKGDLVLDVGCGNGAFVELALNRGVQTFGIETNKAAVQLAERSNLPVFYQTLEEFSSQGRKRFDAVCSFQVLEHLRDPVEFFGKLRSLVRPGGKLIVAVPNGDGWLTRTGSLLDTLPHHSARWGKKSLIELGELAGCRVKKISSEPLREVHIPSYVQSILTPMRSPDAVPRAPRARVVYLAKLLIWFLRVSKAHKLLTGHTLVVEYEVVFP